VGGDKPIRVNVRVLVATHRNLEELVKQNAFRRDLFHRVYVFPLPLPPLRERPEDFPSLVGHFARQVAAQNAWKRRFSPTMRLQSCGATVGREMCANSAM